MPALPRRDLGFAYLRLCRGGDQAWQNFLNKPPSPNIMRRRHGLGGDIGPIARVGIQHSLIVRFRDTTNVLVKVVNLENPRLRLGR
jgi:hypothetical protein